MGKGNKARRIQFTMGTVFTGMGLLTMLFPSQVVRYSFTKEFLSMPDKDAANSPALLLSIQCFGSQASLCGLLILSSQFNKQTFLNFGLAMIPYFIFDYYYWQQHALTNFGAIADGIGNIVFGVCCYLGYQYLDSDVDG